MGKTSIGVVEASIEAVEDSMEVAEASTEAATACQVYGSCGRFSMEAVNASVFFRSKFSFNISLSGGFHGSFQRFHNFHGSFLVFPWKLVSPIFIEAVF